MELTKRKNGTVPTFSGLLDEFFSRELNSVGGRTITKSTPAVNIRETADKFVLEMVSPGMSKEDFNIEVTSANMLIISSEKKQKKEEKNENGRFTLREFSYSAFSRSFSLPESVNADEIQANYKDGLLELTLPKKPEALPQPARTIQIN